jgi:hypothetical protein
MDAITHPNPAPLTASYSLADSAHTEQPAKQATATTAEARTAGAHRNASLPAQRHTVSSKWMGWAVSYRARDSVSGR